MFSLSKQSKWRSKRARARLKDICRANAPHRVLEKNDSIYVLRFSVVCYPPPGRERSFRGRTECGTRKLKAKESNNDIHNIADVVV